MQICVTRPEYVIFQKLLDLQNIMSLKYICCLETFPEKIDRVKRRGDNCLNANSSQDNSHWLEASFSLFTESVNRAHSVSKSNVCVKSRKFVPLHAFFSKVFFRRPVSLSPSFPPSPPPRSHDQLVRLPVLANALCEKRGLYFSNWIGCQGEPLNEKCIF